MKPKHSIWFKSLATFLAFIIVIQVLPLSALAENITQSSASDISNEQNMEVVGEVVDKRTEYQKTYELSDGTYYEITSASPIHEKSGSEWVEPDISEDAPETTQEAEDYVKDLSENIPENTNDEYGIAPASIEINDPTEQVLQFNIVSASSNNLTYLGANCEMYVKTPQIAQNSSSFAQVTTSCEIKINYQNYRSGSLYAYQISDSFDINDETLNKNKVKHYNSILDFQQITSSGNSRWDITDAYLKWEKGIYDNNGIAFVAKSNCRFQIEQCSMIRHYKVLDMYDSDFTYHSIDMGRAGTVYINDFTNTVLIKRNELNIDGNILPVDLVRYIDLNGNSSVGNPYGKDTRFNYESGIRMVTSYTYAWDSFDGETVYFTPTNFGQNNSYIDWEDTSGYGYEMRIFAAGINGTDYSQTILKNEEEGITYSFNSIGKIIKISKGSDSIEIVYTKDKTVNIDNTELSVPDGLIDYIQDGNGRRYYFNYNPGKIYDETNDIQKNTLESIEVKAKNASGSYEAVTIDNQPIKLSFEYELLPDGNIALSKVTYPDSETVSYVYGYKDKESTESQNDETVAETNPDSDNYLSAIIDTDGRKLELQYSGEVRIYTAPKEYESKTVDFYPSLTNYSELVENIDNNDPSDSTDDYFIKSSLSIDRHNSYQRTFTDQEQKQELIQYNPSLKILYYRNSDGNDYYADYSTSYEQQLTQLFSPKEYVSLLDNYDFEEYEDSYSPWVEEEGNSLSLEKGTLSGEGTQFIRVHGSTDHERYVAQGVKIDGKSGDIFGVGAWGRGNTPIPVQSHFFGIEVYAAENYGTEKEPFIVGFGEPLYKLAFDTTLDYEEQFRLGAFQLEDDTKYVEVRLVYSYQSGTADFDEIKLYKSSDDEVTFFNETDEQADVSTLSEDTDTQTITNDKGLTTAEITSDGNKSMVSKYSYDDSYYLSSSTDTNNVTTGYSYDPNNGMLNSVTIGDKVTSFSYTPVGALKEVTRAVSGLTDNVSNISASYTYSHDRITSVTHNGIKYNFTYNSFGNVKNVDLEVLNNDSLDYDLISYDYSLDSKQNLNSITYANGDALSYTYDDNGNVTQISFKSSSDESPRLMYKYEYSNGEISKITDYDSDRVTEYSDNGYTIKEITYGEDGSEQYTEIYAYSVDENGIIHETINGNEYTITENASDFDENTNETTYSSVTQFSFEGVTANINSSSVSDYFGRIKSSELSLTAADTESDFSHSIENSYTYMDYTASYSDGTEEKSVAATTNLIDTFESEIVDNNGTNEEVSNVFTSSYEYDSVGRITHVYYSLNNSASELVSYYQYDESGQVVTDVDFQNDRVTKYAYDSGGNITSKTIYEGEDSFSFNSDTDTLTLADTPTSTINYGYGYAGASNAQNELVGFTDLLTSYNGQSINYNGLGYPLTYYNAASADENTLLNFEWEGTLLKSATTSDGKQKYIYSYNQEGLRTNKEIYSLNDDGSWKLITAIDYFWSEDILTAFNLTFDITEDQGPFTISLKVLYDEYQSPIGVSIDTNAQQTASNENISTYSNSDGINISSSLLTTDDIWWFVKDGQGNVTEMYGEVSGKTLRCSYDSYGNRTIEIDGTVVGDLWDQIADNMQGDNAWLAPILILFGTIATAASLVVILNVDQSTFKGYIYDNETGLYYCQNRYYSPSWGRFISMDDPAELTQNMEEPLNANLYTYCYNDPVNNIDPNGLSTYSLTGVGLQAEMSQNLLSFSGDVGIEMVYVPTKDELYTYYYYSSGAGTGYMNKAINYLNNALNNISINSNISLKNLANLLKLNYSISLGAFGTYTNKSFSWPYSYTGMASSNPVMIGKWNGYQSTSPGCKTYGIYYSPVGNAGSAFSKTSVMYQKIEFDSSAIKSYLSAQQNNIKNAIS